MFLLLQIWITTTQMAPYLLLGFLVAGTLSVVIPSGFVARHLGHDRIGSIVKSTAAGIPLPLCSCGVIPVAADLKKRGASNGAVTSFLISTPQTGVDSIMVTYALLGPIFTIFRVLSALVGGIAGGLLVTLTSKEGFRDNHDIPAPLEADVPQVLSVRIKKALNYGFTTLPEDIGSSLIAGILIAGAISALIPENSLTMFNENGLLSKMVMLLAGIPVYVCATSSIPVAAALIAKGVSPGSALVFLMTGPATNAASIAAVNKMMGKKATAALLVSVAVTALFSGFLLDAYAPVYQPLTTIHNHSNGPSTTENIFGIVLLAIVLKAIFLPSKSGSCCSSDNSSCGDNVLHSAEDSCGGSCCNSPVPEAPPEEKTCCCSGNNTELNTSPPKKEDS